MSNDKKDEGSPKMAADFSAEKVINAVNSAKTLDEKIKAYLSASGCSSGGDKK